MSRLPRRPLRVKPPLRGRAATQHYRGEFAPIASVRRPSRPYGSAPAPYPQVRIPLEEPKPPVVPPLEDTEVPPTHPPDNGLYEDLAELYKSWGRFLRSLDTPKKWLLALAIVLGSLLLLNRFL